MEGEEDEIPLLEGMSSSSINHIIDLGIDIEKIKAKFTSILTQKGIKENADHDDLAGPVLVCVIFGMLLLFVSTLTKINNFRKEKFSLVTSTALASQAAWAYTL